MIAGTVAFITRNHKPDYARVKNHVAPNNRRSTAIATANKVARLDLVAGCSDSNIFHPQLPVYGGFILSAFSARSIERSAPTVGTRLRRFALSVCKPHGRRFSQFLTASPNEWRKRPRRLTTKSFWTGVSTQTESYRDAR